MPGDKDRRFLQTNSEDTLAMPQTLFIRTVNALDGLALNEIGSHGHLPMTQTFFIRQVRFSLVYSMRSNMDINRPI